MRIGIMKIKGTQPDQCPNFFSCRLTIVYDFLQRRSLFLTNVFYTLKQLRLRCKTLKQHGETKQNYISCCLDKNPCHDASFYKDRTNYFKDTTTLRALIHNP